MKIFFKTKSRGYTIIEVIVVIVIILTLAFLTTVNLEGFRRSSLVADASREVVATLESAKSKTLAGERGFTYKVHFSATSYELRDQNDTVIAKTIMDQSLVIVPPAADISFTKVSGKSNGGTVVIRYGSGNPQKTITVSTFGIITEQ